MEGLAGPSPRSDDPEAERGACAGEKNQVGTGDRSERIRTYNFPQGRVTDHRINLTVYNLETFLDGEIGEMIEALITHFQTESLKNSFSAVA